MDRTIPFDIDATCDECGKKGAYDFMGDYLCDRCASKVMYTDCECSKDCDCNLTDEKDYCDCGSDDESIQTCNDCNC